METRTGKQRKARRLKALAGGGKRAGSVDVSYDRTSERSEAGLPVTRADTDIVCYYGVAVQCTSIEGLELVEFEFLPAA